MAESPKSESLRESGMRPYRIGLYQTDETSTLISSPKILKLCVKVTVEVSDVEMKQILKVTREKRKGAAIRQLALEAMMLKKRREILDELEAGKWSVDLPPIETLRADRALWRR